MNMKRAGTDSSADQSERTSGKREKDQKTVHTETEEDNPHSREHATRNSGTFGADEPAYGRQEGSRPTPEKGKKKPNAQGPQYEEGGAYPGTRAPHDADKR